MGCVFCSICSSVFARYNLFIYIWVVFTSRYLLFAICYLLFVFVILSPGGAPMLLSWLSLPLVVSVAKAKHETWTRKTSRVGKLLAWMWYYYKNVGVLVILYTVNLIWVCLWSWDRADTERARALDKLGVKMQPPVRRSLELWLPGQQSAQAGMR